MYDINELSSQCDGILVDLLFQISSVRNPGCFSLTESLQTFAFVPLHNPTPAASKGARIEGAKKKNDLNGPPCGEGNRFFALKRGD